MARRVLVSEFRAQPWRIHAVAPDFAVEDVWRIAPEGAGEDDFEAVVRTVLGGGGRPRGEGAVGRVLFAVRWWLGARLGWDDPAHGVGGRVRPVADRTDLPRSSAVDVAPFSPVYALADEAVSEMANATVHALMHLGWVHAGTGRPELQIAVLTKPNGRRGRAYLRLIAPFRVLLVWPPMLRAWERAWRDRDPVRGGRLPASAGTALELPLRADYLDRFTLATDVVAGPRAWMRTCFEDGVDRPSRELIFTTLLGMGVQPDGTPGTVAGWRVLAEGADRIDVVADGRQVRTVLRLAVAPGEVGLVTAVQHRSRRGALTWAVLSRLHRRLAPGLLRSGAARLRG